MSLDFSFLEDVAPKQQEPEPVAVSGVANITIRVDADCMMQCDGEYVDLPLKAGVMAKTQLPVGQHLLEFFSSENPNIKVEKVVDFPESDKNYLVMVNELKAAIAPPIPQNSISQQPGIPPQNSYLDQLNQMARMNPLASMGMTQTPPPPPPPMPTTPFNNINKKK